MMRTLLGRVPRTSLIVLAGLIILTLVAYQNSPFGPSPVEAASLQVTTEADVIADDGECSLREAIVNANDDADTHDDCAGAGAYGDDTITFAAAVGTITLGSDLPQITDPNGLTIEGGGDVTIDGDGFRPFPVITGSLTLNDLTITGADSGPINGGAIANFGTLTINNSTLSNNISAASGGAIANFGTLTINDSVLSSNTAATLGGGVYSDGGTLTINRSVVSGNTAENGGGVLNLGGGTTNITESTVSNNSATNNGGGVHNGGGFVTLLRSTVGPGNSAATGGGIYSSGITTLTNSTVSGNTATNVGGGIYNIAGTTNLISSTITDNTATDFGGGIFDDSFLTVNLTSSIVADNNPTDCDDLFVSNYVSGGFNLDSDDTCDLTAGGDLPAGSANLGPLQDNGGPTLTHALLAGSAAINAGDNTVCGGDSAPFDQRGSGFARISGGTCDIGAFEVQAAPPPPPDDDEDEEEDEDFGDFSTATPTRTPTPVPTATVTPVPTATPAPSGAAGAISPPATGDGGVR